MYSRETVTTITQLIVSVVTLVGVGKMAREVRLMRTSPSPDAALLYRKTLQTGIEIGRDRERNARGSDEDEG